MKDIETPKVGTLLQLITECGIYNLEPGDFIIVIQKNDATAATGAFNFRALNSRDVVAQILFMSELKHFKVLWSPE